MGEREVVVGGHQGDQALSGLAAASLGTLAVLLAWAPAGAAPPAYCNGQTIVTESGVHYYPNGQRSESGGGEPAQRLISLVTAADDLALAHPGM